MSKFLIIVLSIVLTGWAGNAQRKKVIPVLIVDGFSYHDWRQTTKAAKYILEKSGLFSVSVSTIPSDSIERGLEPGVREVRSDYSEYQ